MGAVLPAGCRPDADPTLFELLTPEATGVTFVNQLPEEPRINILNYLNYYNGGGVAVGDVDGNGLPDLYLTSNLGPNRLYLNRGDYRFEDVTERAGVAGVEGWTTGATMADVNGDGHMDLYVSAVRHLSLPGGNRLYINNADGTFTDCTAEYGLEHEGYSTQAAFLDYDLDGDLDMYLLNHSIHEERGPSSRPQRSVRHPRSGDRLFRNEGDRFVDVSDQAGIYGGVEGYGLGVVASDFDLDGCPDLYVANDFQENDFLYLNDCDGTFTESIVEAMGHTSRSSMGVDAADMDNDGRSDIIVADMLPWREDILKTSANHESYEVDAMKRRTGYHPQYGRNTLQLNRGDGRFSEIAYLAGVAATDWSWAPLFADLDNDGLKDLLVTNGIYHRPNDLDYIRQLSDPALQASLRRGITQEDLRILERMPHIPIPNAVYRNAGNLRFTEVAEAWGLAQPGFSTGAAYADLNDSGALDLVVNNINAPASIYRNRSRELNGHHYLAVRLDGDGANPGGIGARVTVTHAGTRQVLEQMPTRGFQSSVDHRLHFGLGGSDRIDTLIVVWPDGGRQVLTALPVDRQITVSQEDATRDGRRTGAQAGRTDAWTRGRGERDGTGGQALPSETLFTDVTARVGPEFVHRENDFVEYRREPLIPHRLSTQGPALAVADVDGDGLDDVYVGGAKWQPGTLLVQRRDGTLVDVDQPALRADSLSEDVDAAFFDADADGDPDLYVVSGGNEFWGTHEPLRDRLYLNDGAGGFRRAEQGLPDVRENGGVVAPADFDGDGHIDLFVGGRVIAHAYGAAPRSQLLRNDGTGRFVDVTTARAPELGDVGMVSSAAWLDADGDGDLDLVVVGEWMPVRVFRQEADSFVDRTAESGLAGTHGWWNHVAAVDLTGDGREDLVLGNLGLNTPLQASASEPVRLYVHDFDGNGTLDPILTAYRDGMSHPLAGRDELIEQVPSLRGRYPSYVDFGASRIGDIFPRSELRRARVLEARTFASATAVQRDDGTFRLEPLPTEAQLAPIYASLAEDIDGDGTRDLLLAGNFHDVAPAFGRHDASHGLFLRGLGNGRFEPVEPEVSGLVIAGQVRALASLRRAGERYGVVAARNDDVLVFLEPSVPAVRDSLATAVRP